MYINVPQSTLNFLNGWKRAYERFYHKLITYSFIINNAIDTFLMRKFPTKPFSFPAFDEEPMTPILCDDDIFLSLDSIRGKYYHLFNIKLDDNHVLFMALDSLRFFDAQVYLHYLEELRILTNAQELGLDPNSESVQDSIGNSYDGAYVVKKRIRELNQPFNSADYLLGDGDGIIPENLFFVLSEYSVIVCRFVLFICRTAITGFSDGEDSKKVIWPDSVYVPSRLLGSGTNYTLGFSLLNKLVNKEFVLRSPYEGKFVLLNKLQRVRGAVIATIDPSFWGLFNQSVRRFYTYDWYVVKRLKRFSSISFYLLLSNFDNGITIHIPELKRITTHGDNPYPDNYDYRLRVIDPSKEELDEKSPLTFTYIYERKYGGIMKLKPYHKAITNMPKEKETLEDLIGRQAYFLLKSLDLDDKEIAKHEADIKLLWESGHLIRVLEGIKSFLPLYHNNNKYRKKLLIWDVIEDFLVENGYRAKVD